jgi:hypothetical protein
MAVEHLLALQQQSAEAPTPTHRATIQHQIAAVDRHIDDLVYQLYGLTTNEIELVQQVPRAHTNLGMRTSSPYPNPSLT